MTFLNIANVCDMLKCPNNAIFLEFKIPLSNYASFFPFLKEVGGSLGLFFFSCTLYSRENFLHLPVMRKGIQCI